MSDERKIHYSFFQDKPVCGVRGQIYITSDKFYVTCKACLKYLCAVKKEALKDKDAYIYLIRKVTIGKHWRTK